MAAVGARPGPIPGAGCDRALRQALDLVVLDDVTDDGLGLSTQALDLCRKLPQRLLVTRRDHDRGTPYRQLRGSLPPIP